MKVGDSIKIHIPGETPWAIVRKVISPSILMVSLDNTVGKDMADIWNKNRRWKIEPLHNLEYLDVIYVYWRSEWCQYSSERNQELQSEVSQAS